MSIHARSGERRAGGFTLVELVLAFLIIAILSAIGIHTYRGLLEKARMTEAKVVLQHLVKAETIYYGEHDAYTTDISKLDFNPVKYDYYTVTIALDNDMKNFTGTATGTGRMTGDRWYVRKEMQPYQDNTSPFFNK